MTPIRHGFPREYSCLCAAVMILTGSALCGADKSLNTLNHNNDSAPSRVAKSYARLPLSFEANRGQVNQKVKFLSRGTGYTLFLRSEEIVLALSAAGKEAGGTRRAEGVDETVASLLDSIGPRPGKGSLDRPPTTNEPAVLRLQLVGANAGASIVGLNELPGKANYYIGNNPDRWHTNVPTYAKVRYENVFPGIALVF